MSRVFIPGKSSRRREALLVLCPTCGALPKHSCIGTRGNIRTALHADRYAEASGERPA